MTRRVVRILIVATFPLAVPTGPAAHAACVVDLTGIGAKVRVQVDGQWENNNITIPFPVYGEGKAYKFMDGGQPCVTPKKNCNGDSFGYWTVSVDAGWQVIQEGVTYTVGDVERHWDWYYSAPTYAKISGVDFSMNCHGYAFPEAAGTLPDDGPYGAGILLDENDETPCYSAQYVYDANVFTINTLGHSMRVEGFYPCTNPYTAWEIYTKTSEKFRESGVYEQIGVCGDFPSEHSADPLKAHEWAIPIGYTNWTRVSP